MTTYNLGTATIKCPACGGDKLSQGTTAQTKDTATCGRCGNTFSLKAEVDKIERALHKGVGDALRKAFKK